MTQAISVHGFADNNGGLTTDRLHPFFAAEGYEPESYDYGLHLIVSPFNNKWAKELASRVEDGAVGIGHSNGCLILQKAAYLLEKADPPGAKFSQLVFINPALKAGAKLPPHIKACHVWYSLLDVGLHVSRFLPWSKWGTMGATGATGGYPPFINYNKMAAPFARRSYTHLDIFIPDNLNYFGPLIARRVREFEAGL